MMKTIETTAAKIGRSMKKCEMRIGLPSSTWLRRACRRGRRSTLFLRRNLDARPHAHQAVDHDPGFVASSPLAHDAIVADRLPERHIRLLRRTVGLHHKDEFARLFGADRGVRHQQRFPGGPAGTARGRTCRGRTDSFLLSKTARPRMVPVPRSMHVVDEVHAAVCLNSGSSISRKFTGSESPRTVLHRPFCRATPVVPQQRSLVEGEFEPDRIGGHDGGEQSRIATTRRHQVSGRDAAVADAAIDRRAYLGEFEIELGLAHRGLAGCTKAWALRWVWAR